MFGFGRELRRLFGTEGTSVHRDGLTGGDVSLLELLDMRLLRQEAKAADIAAGRVSAKDPAQRRLEAAIIWREVARRSGDVQALRKAASTAEAAAGLFGRERRPGGWARARCEQASCALLGAELFGDDGLNAAADVAFREARAAARSGLSRPLAEIGMLAVEGRARLAGGDAQLAKVSAARFDAPIAGLKLLVRRSRDARLLLVEARLMRADLLLGWGARLGDRALLQQALADIETAGADLDVDHEPLSWARVVILRGQTLVLLGETGGLVETLIDGVNALAGALDDLTRDHSPMDWARLQTGLAQGLQALGEATTSERAYEQAVTCYDRATSVFKDSPALALRVLAASNRALCLARSAELSGDLAVLDAAEAAFRIELSNLSAGREPVTWAMLQVNLARLYESRMEITGRDRGERAAATTALSAAHEVFTEQGLRSLSLLASDALERLADWSSLRARPPV